MERRNFLTLSAAGMAGLTILASGLSAQSRTSRAIRFGGPVFGKYTSPEDWVNLHKILHYRAAYCPVSPGEDAALVNAYKVAAEKNDLIIAEVGAWSNPISPDKETAQKALQKCIDSLALADEIGARCCVNISGTHNATYWAGPNKDNLTDATFDLIVETTRKIIDSVKPTHTFFALEAMPWSYPDSADSYVKLIKAIDRKAFGVHLDPVNLVITPSLYYNNGDMIRDSFKKLGAHIRSCHAKDIVLREDNNVPQFDEIVAGKGNLNYSVFLTELALLKDVPLMMEHLDSEQSYAQAADYIRSIGKKVNLEF
ncbi:MAG: sugar phosphate isomerase/epimerase family protein [Methylococcaceae bacterium]